MISTPSTAISPISQPCAVGQWPLGGCLSASADRMLGKSSMPWSRASSTPMSRGWAWSMYIETTSTFGWITPDGVGNPFTKRETRRSAWEPGKNVVTMAAIFLRDIGPAGLLRGAYHMAARRLPTSGAPIRWP